MGKIKYTKEILEPIVKTNTSLKGVIKELGVEYNNGSHIAVLKAIKRNNINIDHFIKNQYSWSRKRKNNKDIFTQNSQVDRSVIRNRILKEKLIPYICSNCGQDENWMGNKMPLILDHINGINNDNRLENLRFLCSNCDSIQPTYKNKNNHQSDLKQNIRTKINESYNKLENKKIKEEKIKQWEKIIKEYNIDFSKKTWGTEVSKVIGYTPQYCLKFIKENLSFLLK